MRITFDGKPATLDNGQVSSQDASLGWLGPAVNADVQDYANSHLGYWPDLNEVALPLLRQLGTVVIVTGEPAVSEPGRVY